MKNKYSFNIINKIFQRITIALFRFYCLKYDLVIEGKENIPSVNEENYIVVSNHISYDDIPVLTSVFGAYSCFVAKKELFDNPIVGNWFKLCGTISVDRSKPETSTVKAAKAVLQTLGWRLLIFIEGTRSKIEGQLGQPNNGPVFFAKLSKAKLLPVGINYQQEGKVIVRIGQPYLVNGAKDLDEESWKCLSQISKLSAYQLPPR